VRLDPPRQRLGALDVGQGGRFRQGKLASYRSTFGIVRTHVWADRLSKNSVLEALRRGRVYISYDVWGAAKDFFFMATSSQGETLMGDEVPWSEGLKMQIFLPERAEIRLLLNGEISSLKKGRYAEIPVEGPGVFRVEVYKGRKLWILSNPIYVK